LKNNRTSPPTPNTILRHATSIYPSIAFFVGTQLDVFTVLEGGPFTYEELATILKMKPHFMERLLYALVSAELLTVEDGLFTNTVEASNFLVKGKPSYMGDHVNINPFLKYWIVEDQFLILKIMGGLLAVVYLWSIYKRHPKLSIICSSFFLTAYTLIIFWNLLILR